MIAWLDVVAIVNWLGRNTWFVIGTVLLLFSVAAFFWVVLAPYVRSRRIVSASRALAGVTLVRGAFGIVTHARGTLDGTAVVVTRKGIVLEDPKRTLLVPPTELRRLAHDPVRLAAPLREAIRRHRGSALVRSAASGTTCPYCKDALAPREDSGTIRCPSCDSLHHTACWQEHGGCSVHGCARVPSKDRERAS